MVEKSRFLFEIWLQRVSHPEEKTMSTTVMRQQNLRCMNKTKLLSNDLQDDVKISLNESDSNPEVENDVNQDQSKIFENKTQLEFVILLNVSATLYIIDYFL